MLFEDYFCCYIYLLIIKVINVKIKIMYYYVFFSGFVFDFKIFFVMEFYREKLFDIDSLEIYYER